MEYRRWRRRAYLDVAGTEKSLPVWWPRQREHQHRAGGIVSRSSSHGAGKTTLFNLSTQFIKPDHGTVIFNGENLVGMTPEETYRRGIGRTSS